MRSKKLPLLKSARCRVSRSVDRQKLRAKTINTYCLNRGSEGWLGRTSLIFKPLTSDTVFRRYVRQLRNMVTIGRNHPFKVILRQRPQKLCGKVSNACLWVCFRAVNPPSLVAWSKWVPWVRRPLRRFETSHRQGAHGDLMALFIWSGRGCRRFLRRENCIT